MRGVWPVFRLFLVMGICSTVWAGGNPDDLLPGAGQALKSPAVRNYIPDSGDARDQFSGRPDWVYQASDWVLNLYITQKGTRSQGSHGILVFEGDEVRGEPGEVRALPIGKVEYNGPEEGRSQLWDNTGWQMVDPLVKPIVNEPMFPVNLRSQGSIDIDLAEGDIPEEN